MKRSVSAFVLATTLTIMGLASLPASAKNDDAAGTPANTGCSHPARPRLFDHHLEVHPLIRLQPDHQHVFARALGIVKDRMRRLFEGDRNLRGPRPQPGRGSAGRSQRRPQVARAEAPGRDRLRARKDGARMRWALGVSYNGQAYDGWQSQPSGRTVQDKLEAALAQFAARPVATGE